MILLWILIGALSCYLILYIVSNHCGTKLTSADYREDLIHSAYKNGMGKINEGE